MTFVRFAGVRLALGLLTLLLAVTVVFVVVRATGDPTAAILGDNATPEQIAQLRHQLGYDLPVLQQYGDYLAGLLRGDLGDSLRFSRPNTELIGSRLGATMLLSGVAVLLGVLVGVPLGTLAGWREGRGLDRVISAIALVGQSTPVFWLGTLLIIVFAIGLRWLPAGQAGGIDHLVLPALALATIPLAGITRLTRSAVTDVLEEPYVAAARARGLSETRVLGMHVLRNAAMPVLTFVGVQAGVLLSGAVTVEFVFAWPGLGGLAAQAVQYRDAALVQALVVVGAALFVVINLTIDLVYGLIDPRVRE